MSQQPASRPASSCRGGLASFAIPTGFMSPIRGRLRQLALPALNWFTILALTTLPILSAIMPPLAAQAEASGWDALVKTITAPAVVAQQEEEPEPEPTPEPPPPTATPTATPTPTPSPTPGPEPCAVSVTASGTFTAHTAAGAMSPGAGAPRRVADHDGEEEPEPTPTPTPTPGPESCTVLVTSGGTFAADTAAGEATVSLPPNAIQGVTSLTMEFVPMELATPTPTPSPTPTPTPSPTSTPSPTPTPFPTPEPEPEPEESLRISVTSGGTYAADAVAGVVAQAAPTPVPNPPTGYVFGTAAFELNVTGDQGQTITQLTTALTLTVPYTTGDLALAGGLSSGLSLWYLEPATNQWTKLSSTVDATNRKVTASTTRVSVLFSVMVAVPSPTLTGPASGTLVTDMAPLLAWSYGSATGIVWYQIQVSPFNSEGPGISLIIGAPSLVAAAQYQVLAPQLGVGNYVMLPGMTHTWRVRISTQVTQPGAADDALGWSPYVSRTFKTQAPSSATILPVSPVVGGTVTSLTPTLQWENSDTRIFYYEIQVSKDATFNTDPATATAAVYWEVLHGGVTTPLNSYAVRPQFALEAGATYSWRLRPRIQGDGTPVSWSATWNFTTP